MKSGTTVNDNEYPSPPSCPCFFLSPPPPIMSGYAVFLFCFQQQGHHEQVQVRGERKKAAGRCQGETRFGDDWDMLKKILLWWSVSWSVLIFSVVAAAPAFLPRRSTHRRVTRASGPDRFVDPSGNPMSRPKRG